GGPGPPLVSPGEGLVDDAGLGHERRAVPFIEGEIAVGRSDGVAEERIIPLQLARVLPGVGIEEELVRIESVPRFRLVGPMDAVAVHLTRTSLRQISVEDLIGV